MNILISGAGIAGPTLAYWLAHYGHRFRLVEKAPALRTGGYVIDFWGLGYDVAQRMGVLDKLQEVSYPVSEVRCVDTRGEKSGGFSTRVFDRIAGGRYMSLARGDLAETLYRHLDPANTLFGDEIVALEEGPNDVLVRFGQHPEERYDLVVGADGLHSQVRSLVFGPQEQFETYLGYKVAAFESDGYRPRLENVYVMYSQPGIQLARFALRGDRTLFLFVYADPDPSLPGEPRAELRRRFQGQGWECDAILQLLEDGPDLYFDRVSQTRMPAWSRGRVALIGDAAACPSLLAGQGSALAMLEAYVLAGELHLAQGDYQSALAAYHDRLGTFLRNKQDKARHFAKSFVPASALQIFLRNQLTRLFKLPLVAELTMGGEFSDPMELPSYALSAERSKSASA